METSIYLMVDTVNNRVAYFTGDPTQADKEEVGLGLSVLVRVDRLQYFDRDGTWRAMPECSTVIRDGGRVAHDPLREDEEE